MPRADGAVFYDTLTIDAHGTPRSIREVETITNRTADIASFYAALLGDIPYPTLTVALTDSRLPGGHSPAYFAVMSHELPRHPGMMVSWKTDPVSFSSYPSFFLAHEIAHQWFGDAVTEGSWSHLWLSEGFATYFGALFFERAEGVDRAENDVVVIFIGDRVALDQRLDHMRAQVGRVDVLQAAAALTGGAARGVDDVCLCQSTSPGIISNLKGLPDRHSSPAI